MSSLSPSPFQGVRAVVFDLYGTLLTITERRAPYRRMLAHLRSQGRPAQADDAARLMTVDAGLAGAAEAIGARLSPAELTDLERDLFAELGSVRAYDDVVATLEALRQRGFRLALCSNLASPYAVPARLLLPRLDVYGFSFDIGAVKPQSQIYAAVCGELGLAPREVLMVGDTWEADVHGPLSFGMHACHLVRDGERSPATHQIETLRHLPGLLP